MNSLEELAKSKHIEFNKLDYSSRKETLGKLLEEYRDTKYFDNSKFFDDLKFVYSLIYQIDGATQKINDTILPFISSLISDKDGKQIIFLPCFYRTKDNEYVFFVSIRVHKCSNGRGYNVVVGELLRRLERKEFLELCLDMSRDLEKNGKPTKDYKADFTDFTPCEVKVSKRRPSKIFNIIKNVYLVVKKLNTPVKPKKEKYSYNYEYHPHNNKENEQKQTLQAQLELLKLQIALVEKQLESLN